MIFIIILVLICGLLHFINNYIFNYWRRREIIQIETQKFLFGNAERMLKGKRCFGDLFADLYNKNKKHRFIGAYLSYRPIIILNDPDLIQDVMISNFASFHDRPVAVNADLDPLSLNLFFIKGQRWRDLRVKISPAFSSHKIKMMFPIMRDCGQTLQNCIAQSVNNGQFILEFRELTACFTTSIIASVGFGIESDCINDNKNIFRKMGKRIFEIDFQQGIKNIIGLLLPTLFERLGLHVFPKDVEDFIFSIVTQTVDYREKNNINRNDFIQLMIQLKNCDNANNGTGNFTIKELVAQVFVFFIAGFETSSSTMAFALYELVKDQNIQEKVYKEINFVLKNEGISIESLNKMKYLDCCVDETLRKYPIVPVLFRTVTKDYKIPDTNVVIEKGNAVYIPLMGIQRDPNIYEEPLKFKPERFLKTSDENQKRFYMPFGTGGRVCIGARMGKIQTKLGLAMILSKFKIECNDKSLIENEIEFNPTSFVITPIKKFNFTVSMR